MAVKIRLQRRGGKNAPVYRLVAIDGRTRRDGRFVEQLGVYDPRNKKEDRQILFNLERVDYWLGTGAQPSETARSLIKKARKKPPPEPEMPEPPKAREIPAPETAAETFPPSAPPETSDPAAGEMAAPAPEETQKPETPAPEESLPPPAEDASAPETGAALSGPASEAAEKKTEPETAAPEEPAPPEPEQKEQLAEPAPSNKEAEADTPETPPKSGNQPL